VCSELAKEALEKNCSVYERVLDRKLLSREALDGHLALEKMIQPGCKKE
jgi:aspartate ammonia-lyase